MTDFVKMLTRKNSLRKQCQELTAAEIEKVVTDLTLILEEKRESEQAMIAAEQERLDKIDAIRKSMQEAGIELDDLMGMVETTTKKKVEPKYQVTDEEGEQHFWSGRGRTPIAFQKHFEKGFSKEDCLIK